MLAICVKVCFLSHKNCCMCWHNGSTLIFCAGDCLFDPEPIPTSAETSMWGSNRPQEVCRCSTRGGSLGMYITFASAKQANKGKTHSGFETQRRRQKSKNRGTSGPKILCSHTKVCTAMLLCKTSRSRKVREASCSIQLILVFKRVFQGL